MTDLIDHLVRDRTLFLLVAGIVGLLFGMFRSIKTPWVVIELPQRQQLTVLVVSSLLFVTGFALTILNELRNLRITGPSTYWGQVVVPDTPSISEFRDENCRNDYGYEWGIFNDSKWKGKSTVWYEMIERPQGHDYFFRIHFDFGNSPNNEYCGAYTEFSFPPPKILDLTGYSGLSLDAKLTNDQPGTLVRVYLQVAVLGIPNHEYHECLLDLDAGASTGQHGFQTLVVPFSALHTPGWAAPTKHRFDRSRVFRIALSMKCKKGEYPVGFLDVDNIRLVP